MKPMPLETYRPKPSLVTPVTDIQKSRFRVIDAHNHLMQPFGGGWDERPAAELLERLDQAGVWRYVDLDGGWGEDILHHHLDTIKAAAPDRFAMFGCVPWQLWNEAGSGFGELAAKRFTAQVQRGASGLKVWKKLGLELKDPDGKLVRVNDPRLDPVWSAAGESNVPVLIHVADPVAFFQPLDETNERWEELNQHPDWQFPSPPFPSFLSIMNDLDDLIGRHPGTVFIGAHVCCYAENLAWVSGMLDRHPNFHVDMAARLGELGRQPYTARRFFLKYPDRIMFGTDVGPDLETYPIYYRFLETEDEYFMYNPGDLPLQGRWQIYGLHLPDDVLAQVYYRNAARLIFHEEVV